ncbi:hypothetical protein C1S70_30215 (plasmid) [Azospirillum argentinense]|uniref:Uncharacterized protein n=1 Tax=Azospirillum argentinense TaxID=2970906 RepID=A0A2K1FRL4_9PROT|nr:hypothetical protein C1S70_30215 [Azospirillum argentinense]
MNVEDTTYRSPKRGEVLKLFQGLPVCLVVMEACGTVRHRGREITAPSQLFGAKWPVVCPPHHLSFSCCLTRYANNVSWRIAVKLLAVDLRRVCSRPSDDDGCKDRRCRD